MVFLPDFFESRQTRETWLGLPVGEVALLLAQVHSGDGLLNLDYSLHTGSNCTLDGDTIQPVPGR